MGHIIIVPRLDLAQWSVCYLVLHIMVSQVPGAGILHIECILHLECSTFHSIIFQDLK